MNVAPLRPAYLLRRFTLAFEAEELALRLDAALHDPLVSLDVLDNLLARYGVLLREMKMLDLVQLSSAGEA